MIKYKYCVLGICTINCLYSMSEFGNMKAYDGPETEYMWMGLYILNVILNVLVLVRFYYADRYPVLIWFAFTVPLFLIRLTCTPYNLLSPLYVIICGFVDAYIFVTFFIMGAAYKNLANSAPGERTTTHSAPAQVDWHPGRGVRFINPPPSTTRYEPSQFLYETHTPNAPVFIGDSNVMCTDIPPLNNYHETNNKDNCCAAERGKCDSGKDIAESEIRGRFGNYN